MRAIHEGAVAFDLRHRTSPARSITAHYANGRNLPPTAAIVDAIVASNELPNMPHLDSDVVKSVALAKIK